MTEALLELERRVAALEREMSALRQVVAPSPAAAPGGGDTIDKVPMLREARANASEWAEGWKEFMKLLGIEHLKPVGPEKLRELMLAEGIDPTSNEFSRGIIEMRDE